MVFIHRTACPRIFELGYVEADDAFLGQNSYPEGRTFPNTLIVRFDARLYFANIPFLEEWLISETADRPNLRLLDVDCRGINSIDVTAIEGLESLVSEYRFRRIEVLLTHVKPQVKRGFARQAGARSIRRSPGTKPHGTLSERSDLSKRATPHRCPDLR